MLRSLDYGCGLSTEKKAKIVARRARKGSIHTGRFKRFEKKKAVSSKIRYVATNKVKFSILSIKIILGR